MWLFTTHGLLSVVKRKRSDQFQVRARVRKTLEQIAQLLYREDVEIIETSDSDYRYRVLLSFDEWLKLIQELAGEVDYSNFKHEVAALHGEDSAYYSLCCAVWEEGAMRLQEGAAHEQ
jgi:hypothetical protein